MAIALPLPPEWPAYSTTIILVTVVSRLAFTVPFSVWVCVNTLPVTSTQLNVAFIGEEQTMASRDCRCSAA